MQSIEKHTLTHPHMHNIRHTHITLSQKSWRRTGVREAPFAPVRKTGSIRNLWSQNRQPWVWEPPPLPPSPSTQGYGDRTHLHIILIHSTCYPSSTEESSTAINNTSTINSVHPRISIIYWQHGEVTCSIYINILFEAVSLYIFTSHYSCCFQCVKWQKIPLFVHNIKVKGCR